MKGLKEMLCDLVRSSIQPMVETSSSPARSLSLFCRRDSTDSWSWMNSVSGRYSRWHPDRSAVAGSLSVACIAAKLCKLNEFLTLTLTAQTDGRGCTVSLGGTQGGSRIGQQWRAACLWPAWQQSLIESVFCILIEFAETELRWRRPCCNLCNNINVM